MQSKVIARIKFYHGFNGAFQKWKFKFIFQLESDFSFFLLADEFDQFRLAFLRFFERIGQWRVDGWWEEPHQLSYQETNDWNYDFTVRPDG